MPRYIRVNNLKLTLREDLRMARSWKVLVLWVPKLLRKRLDFMSGIPIPVPFQDYVVTAEELSPAAEQTLARSSSKAKELGFGDPVFQIVPSLRGEMVSSGANFVHGGGEIVARLMHVLMSNVHPPKQRLGISFLSALADGRRLVTTDQRSSFLAPPNLIVQRRIGASLEELFALHRGRLDQLTRDSAVERVLNESELAAFCDRAEMEAMEFHSQRGVYEEIRPEEAAVQTAQATADRALAGDNETDIAVLAEMEKLHNAKGSWRSALTVAVLSLAAFVALGGMKWNWGFVLLLTAVVGFHEMGHYVAMRLLHYRDVRMFFVPLLGAAVTGRHYNVSGWKKAVVSLSGPLPGIVLGWVLFVLGLVTHSPVLERTALIALLLNGINLLPFVPLDGGWVMHALFFSRHFILETAFLGLAGVSLVGASMLGLGRLWMYLGILMLVGLPASYRLARVAGRLRARGFSAASADAQTIPPETALAILQEVKTNAQGAKFAKGLASQVLAIFQKLNATPPSAAISALLLLVYLGSCGGAMLGIGAIFAARTRMFQTPLADVWIKPARLLDPAGICRTGATNETEFACLTPTVVANCNRAAEAKTAFETAKLRLHPGESLTLCGQSLFLTGSNWLGRLELTNAQIFTEKPLSHQTAILTLSCAARDEAAATEIAAHCDAFFKGQVLKLWPPWTDLDALEPERKQAAQCLWYTWARLNGINRAVDEDPEYKRLAQYPRFRLKRMTAGEMIQQMEKRADIERTIYRRELDRLSHVDDPRLDKQLVDLYGRFRLARENSEASWKAIEEYPAWHRGCLPLSTNIPAHPQAWRAAISGDVQRHKTELRFQYLTFYRTELGFPALISYLHQRGCTAFRYEVLAPASAEDE